MKRNSKEKAVEVISTTIVIRMKTLRITQSVAGKQWKKLYKLLFKDLTTNIHNNNCSLYRTNHVWKRFNCLPYCIHVISIHTYIHSDTLWFQLFQITKHTHTHCTASPLKSIEVLQCLSCVVWMCSLKSSFSISSSFVRVSMDEANCCCQFYFRYISKFPFVSNMHRQAYVEGAKAIAFDIPSIQAFIVW